MVAACNKLVQKGAVFEVEWDATLLNQVKQLVEQTATYSLLQIYPLNRAISPKGLEHRAPAEKQILVDSIPIHKHGNPTTENSATSSVFERHSARNYYLKLNDLCRYGQFG